MYMDSLYHEVAKIVENVLAQKVSIRTAVYGSTYKVRFSMFLSYLYFFFTVNHSLCWTLVYFYL